jgi:hypothetical protein
LLLLLLTYKVKHFNALDHLSYTSALLAVFGYYYC